MTKVPTSRCIWWKRVTTKIYSKATVVFIHFLITKMKGLEMVKCESLRINMFRITHTGKVSKFSRNTPLYTWKRFFHCDTLWGRGHGYFIDIKVALYQRNLFTGIICVKKIERSCFVSDPGGLENFMYLRDISFLMKQILCTIFL